MHIFVRHCVVCAIKAKADSAETYCMFYSRCTDFVKNDEEFCAEGCTETAGETLVDMHATCVMHGQCTCIIA